MHKLIALLIGLSLFSCVTTRITKLPNVNTTYSMDDSRVEVLGQTKGVSHGGRLWLVFIPLGWGNDAWCEKRAYKKALKMYSNADGVFEQTSDYYKIKIPLLIITPVYRRVKFTGVAYRLRTDAELEEYLKSKGSTTD